MLKRYFYNLANDKTKGAVAFLVKAVLFLLSLIYWALTGLLKFFFRQKIYKTFHLECKVISVGNITWGGTGKTPIVELIARRLSEKGRKVGIQSRGYKSKSTAGGYKAIGDEPFMLQENLGNIPLIVGANRVKAAQHALKKLNLDTIILDDGFQHWRLFRDLDIVAIDATNPFGNGCLIPRGILREGLSALKRAEIFFLTHTDLAEKSLPQLKEKLIALNSKAQIVESAHLLSGFYNILDKEKKIIPVEALRNRKLCLVTAVGNPAAFEGSLLRQGLKSSLKFVFLDHHDFSQTDFENILKACLKDGITTIVTTQKDAVRLKDYCFGLVGFQILACRVEIQITKDEDAFFSRLFSL